MDESGKAGKPEIDTALATAMRRDPHHATRAELEIPGPAQVVTKPGMRGFPDLAPGARELAPYVGELVAGLKGSGPWMIDASGTGGACAAVAAAAAAGAGDVSVAVFEPSAAGLVCAREVFAGSPGVEVRAGVVWDALEMEHARKPDVVVLLPPADRGSQRVHAELAAAASVLAADGTLLIALHKDRGGKRYLKDAERWFGSVETIGRAKGWRVARARAPRSGSVQWLAFEAAGRRFEALPGVFAAGKLDPGTSVLLEALDRHRVAAELPGRRVLDLGCGYGPLVIWAAAAGADATGIDDDVAAVDSTRRSARLNDVRVHAQHSDLDAFLASDARFDVVLCNPPFHVGKQVRLDVSEAFIRAAHRRLVADGVLWLVANRALAYERYLDGWQAVETVQADGGFKVIRAQR